MDGRKMKALPAYSTVIGSAQLEMGSWCISLGKWMASADN